jgi:hypothetical protein
MKSSTRSTLTTCETDGVTNEGPYCWPHCECGYPLHQGLIDWLCFNCGTLFDVSNPPPCKESSFEGARRTATTHTHVQLIKPSSHKCLAQWRELAQEHLSAPVEWEANLFVD